MQHAGEGGNKVHKALLDRLAANADDRQNVLVYFER